MKNIVKNILLLISAVIIGFSGIALISYFLKHGDYKVAGIVLVVFAVSTIIITLLIPHHHEHGVSSSIKGYINLLMKKGDNEAE